MIRKVVSLLLVLMLLGAAPALAATQAKNLRVTFAAEVYQNRADSLLKSINTLRKKEGVETLGTSAALQSAAMQRAAELFVLFDHIRPDFTAPSEMFPGTTFQELIGAGYSKAADAMDGWLVSSPEALIDPDFDAAGIACLRVPDSENEYYWCALLVNMDKLDTKAIPDYKAGQSKNFTVDISKKMYAAADDTHKSFSLHADNISLKNTSPVKPSVTLWDRKDVKIGKCDLTTLTLSSSDTKIFTVGEDGALTRKKAGEATLTIKSAGLDSITVKVSCTGGSTGSSSSKPDGFEDDAPSFSVKEYSKKYTLTASQKGADGYVLYRSKTKNGTYTKWKEEDTSKAWKLDLEREKLTGTYYYKVRAYVIKSGKRVYSEYSEAVRIVP